MLQKFKNKLNKDANLKELLSGSAVTFAIKITGMLIGYGVVLLVSRKYGAEGTGIYSLTTSLLNSLAIFGGLGLNIAVLRYVGQFNKTENGLANMRKLFSYIFQFAFPFAVLVGISLFLLAEEVATKLFENPMYIPALKVGAVALPFFTLNLINVEFIRGLKMLKVSEYLRSINRQLVVIILLLLSVFSFGILDAVYAMVVGILISFVISMAYIGKYFKQHKSQDETSNLERKELLKTSMPMMITAVASFILANAGVVFLEIYSTTDQVGIFNVCVRLAQLVSLVLVVVNTISAPKFAELFWAGKMVELQNVIRQSSRIIFLASFPISLFLMLFSSFVLGLFGKEFTTGTLALLVLIIGQMVNASAGSVGIFLNMSGNERLLRNLIVFTVLLTLIGYLAFIPKYGIVGAAFASTFGTVLLNVACVQQTYKKLKIKTYYLPFLSK
ncbi:Membrane protein involved in the export of O-antigen and teichoic acid [Salegentibacter flavus]|uniref:Membrane protein involved in the export of O-antigen and teichoic acid n=1 Tax=Salegentibacter flavus TaxID=287099 RepID=A0A1I5BP15_9FLAO|nr:Membrane protein involved in the export of O-antigen and teichoic acid [Salegentibacter flavus]